MQVAQMLEDYNFKNLVNESSNRNNESDKKIRSFYSNSKYRNIFYKENKKLKKSLNNKYWVAIQLEKLDDDILSLFDVIVTRIINDDKKEIYKINKRNNLSVQQLALLCDENNLEYGYKYLEKYDCILINKECI